MCENVTVVRWCPIICCESVTDESLNIETGLTGGI